MPRATFCGLPHSESEVYYGKVSAIGLATCRSLHIGQLFVERSLVGDAANSGALAKGS